MNELNIKNQILCKLSEMEQQEHVKILHAVESGSRAWGFASPDSDFDVRVIYFRNVKDYLKLNPVRDVIEFQLDDVFDINGWDVQKMLKLLYKSNPTIFEWMNSPIVYQTCDEFHKLKPLMNTYFSPKTGAFHYLSTAKHNYHAYCEKEQVRLKKYFYVLRPLLACYWIFENQTPPPMLFSEMLTLPEALKISDVIQELLDIKMQTSELGTGEKNQELDSWIHRNFETIQRMAEALPETKNSDWDTLNDVFYKIILSDNDY
ncbi:MAG: nucleotidyltransferase domain-containing protein [Oscillospiraceae bacterium]|nr:nucleotidyltransferase domain-containing protein [Oscillospiraceae bacterium]